MIKTKTRTSLNWYILQDRNKSKTSLFSVLCGSKVLFRSEPVVLGTQHDRIMVILSNIILFVFAGTTCLSAFYVRCEDETENMSSNCYIRDFSKIRCTGNFNLSNILSEQRKLIEPDADTWSHRKFRGLEIFDSDIEEINENVAQFHGFIFETILIENAPNLKSITPNALVELRDDLTDFRAINTGLPQYNDFGNGPQEKENPFDDFKELREVYIGKQTRCPSDQTLLFPCTCEFGELSRTVPLGLYGWSHGISNIFGTTAQVTCDNENLTGDQLKKAFENLSRSDHEPKHFDVLTIRGATSLTDIPSNVFSNISITTIWMEDVTNLRSIHSKAFVSETSDYGARSIQVLDISTANFTMANADEVDDLFDALSSLTNIRVLRFSKCGIPFIPPHAFTPEHHSKQLNNLRYLSLSLDRKHHKSGIRSIGSYAFSAAPKLVELAVERNFIEEFDAFAFAFNQTSNKQLTIHIGGNPFNDTVGLKANAFSGIRRPTRIIFEVSSFDASDEANDPSLNYMPENVFRPFIEENAENYFEVNYYNVDIWCDCGSKWMFDEVGNLRPEVQNGLRIKRITDNVIASDPLSIQCKANSSFDCLPNCLTFPSAGLIHCGGNGDFDIKSTFLKLGQSIEQKKLSKLMFSSKGIRELPMESFGSFQFEIVDFAGTIFRDGSTCYVSLTFCSLDRLHKLIVDPFQCFRSLHQLDLVIFSKKYKPDVLSKFCPLSKSGNNQT